MPTITGRTKLPGGTMPLVGTWYARIRTIVGATIDNDGTIRAGIEAARDSGDGATMTLPAGSYEFRFESSTKNPDTGHHDQYGWYPFDLTDDVSWGDIMETPTDLPVTPTDVRLANEAAERAEAAAVIAQGSSGGIGGATDNGDGTVTLAFGTSDITAAVNAAFAARGSASNAADSASAAASSAAAAQAVGTTNDGVIAGRINAAGSQTQVALSAATAAQIAALASVKLDDDGVPYITDQAGNPGSPIAFDTDGAPYLTGA